MANAIVSYSSISAIGAFTALNGSAADSLMLDPSRCTGGGDPPLRTTVEPSPGQDGALILPAFDDAWIVTLGGQFRITSSSTESGYIAAIASLYATLKTDLDLLKAASGTLTHSAGSMKVWKYAGISDGWQGGQKTVTFSLVVDVFA